jgi:hypothetical protein
VVVRTRHEYVTYVTSEKRRDRVSATEAGNGLGGLVDEVRERGATFTIERGGVPVARLGPVLDDTPCTAAALVPR